MLAIVGSWGLYRNEAYFLERGSSEKRKVKYLRSYNLTILVSAGT